MPRAISKDNFRVKYLGKERKSCFMTKELAILLSNLELGTYANVAQKLHVRSLKNLPADYMDFISKHNGAIGFIGTGYLDLWTIENVVNLNPYFSTEAFSQKVIIIGTNGSGILYGYDLENHYFFESDEYGMNEEEAIKCGDTFLDFLKYLINVS